MQERRRKNTFGENAARLATVVVTVVASACGGSTADREAPPEPTVVRLTSGLPGASFHPLGARLAEGYARVIPNVLIDVQESPGSVRNVQALQRGTADIGFAFADVTYVSYVGRLTEEAAPFDRLRGIAVLQLTPLHLVVRPGLGVQTIGDLRGMRVGTGPPGSGTELTASILMRAFGVPPTAVRAETLPFNEASRKLVAGRLDAAFVSAGYPSQAVEIATRAGATLAPVDGPNIARFRGEYPFLRLTFVPGGIYPGHPRSIPTIGVDSLLLCRDGLDEDLVYNLTKAFFEVLPDLSSEVESLRLMNISRASATPIPLHPGAARYYRERELMR